MRVVHVAYGFAPVGPDAIGGAEQVVSALDVAAAGAGEPSVVIASADSEVAGTLVPIPPTEGRIDVAVRRRVHGEQQAALREVLRTTQVDVVHMHGVDFADVLPAVGLPEGPPVLVTLHVPPESFANGALASAPPGAHFVCVSDTQHRALAGSLPLLSPVRNGVSLDALDLRLPKLPYVLSLGRVCREKGFHDALDAARLAHRPMFLAGRVFAYPEHESYYAREILPRLDGLRRFIGPVGFERRRRLMAAASCVLIPARTREPSSLLAMEALACGTPVIAYPSGALSELIEHGRTGFLVDSVQAMAHAIQQAGAIDPEVCRATARERFSADRMVEEYRERYREIVARRPREHVA